MLNFAEKILESLPAYVRKPCRKERAPVPDGCECPGVTKEEKVDSGNSRWVRFR